MTIVDDSVSCDGVPSSIENDDTPKMVTNIGFGQDKTCPDCKGKKKIALFRTVKNCERCEGTGVV